MFKQLFDSMNELMDEIIQEYPAASGKKKEVLEEKLTLLKKMSDVFIEEWLLFEDKMGRFLRGQGAQPAAPVKSQGFGIVPPSSFTKELDKAMKQSDSFRKGQGYYQLLMYDEAVAEFEEIVKKQPDFLLARVYLAMGHLRKENYGEAYRHFQFLLPLTDNQAVKAISYNAMGCIQVQNRNMDKAFEYFKMAYENDPNSVEPLMELSSQDWDKLTPYSFEV